MTDTKYVVYDAWTESFVSHDGEWLFDSEREADYHRLVETIQTPSAPYVIGEVEADSNVTPDELLRRLKP